MAAVELYSYEACPFAQRTRMVLLEKGIEFSLTEIDINNKPEGWEKISPYGKVPLLRHDGGTIYESAIINQYLDEVFPETPMMPASALPRALARIWMDYCDNRYLPACFKLAFGRNDPEKMAANLEAVEEGLLFIEHEGFRKIAGIAGKSGSDDGPYWFGTTPGLVDFHYMPFFERFACYEELFGASIPAECTRLNAWLAAMQDLDSVRATSHDREYHLEQYRRRIQAA